MLNFLRCRNNHERQWLYYLGAQFVSLGDEEANARLIHRLRQYLEIRNFTLLIGNGCSIPLGAPLISDASRITTELDVDPFRLNDPDSQDHATRRARSRGRGNRSSVL